jgi:hypothetical protein
MVPESRLRSLEKMASSRSENSQTFVFGGRECRLNFPQKQKNLPFWFLVFNSIRGHSATQSMSVVLSTPERTGYASNRDEARDAACGPNLERGRQLYHPFNPARLSLNYGKTLRLVEVKTVP